MIHYLICTLAIFTAIGFVGFFKACKFIHIIPTILQILLVAVLIYSDINAPKWLYIALFYPYFFMYIGYKQNIQDLKKAVNYIKHL